MTGPYTPGQMDAARSSDETRAVRDVRIDGLRAEASEAVGYGANTLRAVSQRYRAAYTEELGRWQRLRDELDETERARAAESQRLRAVTDVTEAEDRAEEERIRALRAEVEALGGKLGEQQTELAKFDIALKNLESIITRSEISASFRKSALSWMRGTARHQR